MEQEAHRPRDTPRSRAITEGSQRESSETPKCNTKRQQKSERSPSCQRRTHQAPTPLRNSSNESLTERQ
jgi:hypothetical protein